MARFDGYKIDGDSYMEVHCFCDDSTYGGIASAIEETFGASDVSPRTVVLYSEDWNCHVTFVNNFDFQACFVNNIWV